MTSSRYPGEHAGRSERRRVQAALRRRRARRNAALVGVVLIVVLAGAGAWLGYRLASRKPSGPETYTVVVPEGLTVGQTAEKVEGQCRISADGFMKAVADGGYDFDLLEGAAGLEGFLFPKTYTVTERTSSRALVGKMLGQFETETSGLDWSKAAELGVSPYQVLIIASLIEKEAKVPGERPVIASVIYNRLRAGMRLQIDATVQYALGRWKRALSYEDLKVDSPYNTYRVDGLPPGPICSPGFESIRSALHPSSTDYLYYILTGSDGSHSFTADYQEFLRWKEQRDGSGG